MTTISNSSRPVLGGNAQPVYVTNTVDLGGNAQPVYLTNGVNDLTGLEADAASAATSAAIVQEHFHNFERWYGASAGQIGPGVQVSGTPFRVTSSATSGTFGTAIVVLDGTEANASFQTLFDCHRIVLSDVSTATNVTYWLRLIFAVNGEETAAAAVINNHYTEIPIRINFHIVRPRPARDYERANCQRQQSMGAVDQIWYSWCGMGGILYRAALVSSAATIFLTKGA